MPSNDLITERRHLSKDRLTELRNRISEITVLSSFPKLTIYAAGSYARYEAAQYSDIDLFFIYDGPRIELNKTKMDTWRLFSQLISIADDMNLPTLTDDGKYLEILFSDEMLTHLGGRDDDYTNCFTARMLLLLESTPLLNQKCYDSVIDKVVSSYFRDFQYYPDTFRPTFLINDIMRFWKTLCLNYEHARNLLKAEGLDDVEQTVRDFKLGFSRMLTCFATVAELSRHTAIKKEDVLSLVYQTPQERLMGLKKNVPEASGVIEEMKSSYVWFLEKTGMTEEDIQNYFSDKTNEEDAIQRAHEFGTLMYDVVKLCTRDNDYIRYLVI